ncbi:MAG: type II toxin-antitoxin system VapC family toxin [Dehalococcoidia bacterium]
MDAGYPIAIYKPEDEHHDVAMWWAARIAAERWQMVTTTLVLSEVGDAFAKRWDRIHPFMSVVFADSALEIVPVDAELLQRAVELRTRREDKEWGLTDCVSFVVMEQRGPRDALAVDRHFEQAGFRALLRTEAPDRATARRTRR